MQVGGAKNGPGPLVDVYASRRVYWLVLAIGCVGLVLVAAIDWFRQPYAILVFVTATLVGVRGAFDRRPKLSISPRGIRYARWGGAVVAWEEFAGYRRVSWRSLPHLQLIPRQASQLTQKFSMLGRLEQFCARLLRAPSFAIAVVPLEIDGGALEEEVRKYLPHSPSQA